MKIGHAVVVAVASAAFVTACSKAEAPTGPMASAGVNAAAPEAVITPPSTKAVNEAIADSRAVRHPRQPCRVGGRARGCRGRRSDAVSTRRRLRSVRTMAARDRGASRGSPGGRLHPRERRPLAVRGARGAGFCAGARYDCHVGGPRLTRPGSRQVAVRASRTSRARRDARLPWLAAVRHRKLRAPTAARRGAHAGR